MANLLVSRMLHLIEARYADAITLRTISQTLGRQPAYLGRLFHREVGCTVRDRVARVRMEHAARMIREGVKVEAVALSVGYQSKKNFYQRFRRYYGATPAQYRADSEPSDLGADPDCADRSRLAASGGFSIER